MATTPDTHWIVKGFTKCNFVNPDSDSFKSEFSFRLQVWKAVTAVSSVLQQEFMFKTKEEAVEFANFIRSLGIGPNPSSSMGIVNSRLYLQLIQHATKTVYEERKLSY